MVRRLVWESSLSTTAAVMKEAVSATHRTPAARCIHVLCCSCCLPPYDTKSTLRKVSALKVRPVTRCLRASVAVCALHMSCCICMAACVWAHVYRRNHQYKLHARVALLRPIQRNPTRDFASQNTVSQHMGAYKKVCDPR